MNWLSRSLLLVIIGALNWLLVGLFQWDLVTALLGGETMRTSSMLSRLVYTLVGLSVCIALPFCSMTTKSGRNESHASKICRCIRTEAWAKHLGFFRPLAPKIR